MAEQGPTDTLSIGSFLHLSPRTLSATAITTTTNHLPS
jgi:hypothetical protein